MSLIPWKIADHDDDKKKQIISKVVKLKEGGTKKRVYAIIGIVAGIAVLGYCGYKFYRMYKDLQRVTYDGYILKNLLVP